MSRKPLEIEDLQANYYIVSQPEYGFFLCLEGTGRVQLGELTYEIEPNYLFIYTPNSFFRILERDNELKGVLQVGDIDEYYPIMKTVNVRQRLMIRKHPVVKLTHDESAHLVNLINMINEALYSTEQTDDSMQGIQAEYVRHLRYAVCMLIFDYYFKNGHVEAAPHSREDDVFNRFMLSVHENCTKVREVQFYASEQNLSPYYFSSIIKKQSGKSALQWIESITMTIARNYLSTTTMSLKEIADALNFPDQSTFGRYFKHSEGCSPSQWRSRTKKANKQES